MSVGVSNDSVNYEKNKDIPLAQLIYQRIKLKLTISIAPIE